MDVVAERGGGRSRSPAAPAGRLVAPACRWRRRAAAMGALLVAALAAGCVRRLPPLPPPPAWPFIVTGWCGPPLAELTDARAAALAEAGFTVVAAPCEGPRTPELNHRALDVAARHGLQLWITDARLDQLHDLKPDWAAQLDSAVAEFGGHPALGGYFLVDEPSADKFDDLGLVVGRLRRSDPQRVPYINLLPDYIPLDALGTPTYRAHVEEYLAAVRPPLLSFAYYPFKTDGDRATFFANLALIRELARRDDVPFLFIAQAMPHGPYRDPTEGEIAWQIFNAVAYGARGISYFALWTPVHVTGADYWQFRHGLIEAGAPTEHFAQAARINHQVLAFAAALEGFRSRGVADSAGRVAAPLPLGPLAGVDGPPLTVGLFARPDGAEAVMLVNQDYRATQTARLIARPGAGRAERLDPAARTWQPLDPPTLTLAPGGAALLRWTPRSDAG